MFGLAWIAHWAARVAAFFCLKGRAPVTHTRSGSHRCFVGWRASGLLLAVALCTAQAEPRRSSLFEGDAVRYEAPRAAIQRGQWQLALDALTELRQAHPDIENEAEFHNLKGYALRQSDVRQLPLAIGHYHKALAIDPTHVEAREYLGQAYLLQGRIDLAEQELKAIELHCQGRTCEAWKDLAQAIAAARKQPARPTPSPSTRPW